MSHHKKHHHEQGAEGAEAQTQASNQSPEEIPGAGTVSPAAPGVDELTKVRQERDDYLARLQRLSADFVNYQKRATREMSDIRETANADLMRNMLPVLDDMERAMESAARHVAADDPLLAGITMVHRKALETLERYGLAPIEAQGKPFDPAHHRAVSQVPTKDVPPNTVIQELQRGYALKGRTIRPATVIVSTAPQQQENVEQQEQEEQE